MNPARHARLGEVFAAAAARPVRERAALLDELCAGDAELRREVEGLLDRDERTAMVDEPVGPGAHGLLSGSPAGSALPRRIGGYEVLGLLGEGGMGTVYRARQAHPSRLVALKVLNPALLTPAMVRRFEFEAQVMAALRHPGIAEVHEAGVADVHGARLPYFAMELVTGRPLTEHAEALKLDRRARLELVRTVCLAVHHAHQKGVIHRDLKPGNILVTSAGEPKVLDFGIARTAAPELRTIALQTLPGQIVGTLAYMSPEQLRGDGGELDVRADVYSLGVILYELLGARLPHELRGKSLSEAVRALETEEVPPLGRLDPSLRGDLETIVARAMDKDVARRYQSALDLAREIERHLKGEAIEARRDSRSYVLRRALARHRVPVAVGAAFVLTLAAAAAVSLAFAIGEARQRRRAERGAEETREVARFQAQMFRDIDAEAMGRALKALMRDQVRAGLERPPLGGGAARLTPGEIDGKVAAFEELTAAAQGADMARAVVDGFVLRRAAGKVPERFRDQPLVAAQLHSALGAAYESLGMYAEAEPHRRAALDLRRGLPGAPVSDEIAAMAALADLLHLRHRYGEAEPLYRGVLAACREHYGESSLEGATAMAELASLVANRGEFAESEALFVRALDQLRRTAGDRSLPVATALGNYAEMLRRKGNLKGAEERHREALEVRRAAGAGGEDIAASLNNLANVLTESGRYREAEPLQREALELQRRLLGAEHPDAVSSLHNLANTWWAMDALDEAEAGFSEAIALHERLQRRGDDTALARSLSGLGLVMQARGKFDEGEPLLRRAVAVFQVLGESSPEHAVALGNLAVLLHTKGDTDAAAPLYKRGIEIRRGLPNFEHVEAAGLLNNYAALLRDKGSYGEAEAAYREAIGIFRKVADGHPGMGVALAGLGRVMEATGRPAEAEPLYREAEAVWLKQSPDHPQAAAARARLGGALARLGRFREAEALLLAIAEPPEDGAPPGAANLLLAVERLADLYTRWEAQEPGAGHAERAARWSASLAELRGPG